MNLTSESSGMAKQRRLHVLVGVTLHQPAQISEVDGQADGNVVGYYQRIGVTAPDRRSAEALVEGDISDGSIAWSECETKELSEREVRALNRSVPPIDPPGSPGNPRWLGVEGARELAAAVRARHWC